MPRTPSSSDSWESFSLHLGSRIQRERVARGLSQERVAYQAGLSRYTYQKLEKGESRPGMPANPTVKTLLAIAQVLDLTLAELLPRDVPDLTAR
ncbi:XRE family transcriptional regulator [Microbacterium enclense]|uniref:XRE family transcriptional regulator n=1 Tax=Microbacterium enclense TaxID=993073 RepID=A0A3S3P1S9_9MICO|nr:helix-turn-helix transcriptional regulator [Microbacterium enclense]RWR16197.1 XRE family transcriptional regulator [Microbacterium enclense]